MLSFLRAWTQEFVILIVLATVIDLALPSGVMKKYVDYAVSLVMLLLLLGPVAALLTGEMDMAVLQTGAPARRGITEMPLRPLSDRSIWLTYELLLKDRIEETARAEPLVAAVVVEVALERDTQSKNFGKPISAQLVLTLKDGVLPSARSEMLARLRATLAAGFNLSPAAITLQVAR